MKHLLSIIAAILLLTSIGCTWGNEFEPPDMPDNGVTLFVPRDLTEDYSYADLPRGPGFLPAELPDAQYIPEVAEPTCDDPNDIGDSCGYELWLEAYDPLDTGLNEYVWLHMSPLDTNRPPETLYTTIEHEQEWCYFGHTSETIIENNILGGYGILCFEPEQDILATVGMCGCLDGEIQVFEMEIELNFQELN